MNSDKHFFTLFSRINIIISRCYVDGRVGVCVISFGCFTFILFVLPFIVDIILAFFTFFFAMSLSYFAFLLSALVIKCKACLALRDFFSSSSFLLCCCNFLPAFSSVAAGVCSWIDDRAEEKPECRGDFIADGGGAGGRIIESRAGVRLCEFRVKSDDADDWLPFVAFDVVDIDVAVFDFLLFSVLLLPSLLAGLLLSYYDFVLFRDKVTFSRLSALTKWTDLRFLLAVCDWRELRLWFREGRAGVRELRVRVECLVVFVFVLVLSSSSSLYALCALNKSVDYELKRLLGEVYDAQRCSELRRRESNDGVDACSLL